MKFFVEACKVPIYDRIARAFTNELRRQGHIVYYGDTSQFDFKTFVETINGLSIDYYLSTNEQNQFQKLTDANGRLAFEKIKKRAIFIHHDNLCSSSYTTKSVENKLRAFKETADRSIHFCLESSNVTLLQEEGITNAHIIKHASEFLPNDNEAYRYEASFVGHLMAGLTNYPIESMQQPHHLLSLAWARLSLSNSPLQPRLLEISDDIEARQNSLEEKFPRNAIQQSLVANLNKLSPAFRGELLSKIEGTEITIVGGDLSYGRMNHPLLKISKKNIKYIAATDDYSLASSVYRQSRVNINISSLQFDTAVNNRVIDIVFSGGLVVTDARDDLKQITSMHDEITFKTPEGLEEKLESLKSMSATSKGKDLSSALYNELKHNHSYSAITSNILMIANSKAQKP
jgi:hypothetical protein